MNKSKNEVVITPQFSSACGIDIHKDTISLYATDTQNLEVLEKDYGTTTRNLRQIVSDIKIRNIKVVLMESTGIYWISLYHMLTEQGINTIVANPSHIKQMPKQKTDRKDAKWLCKLAINNMVRHSIVPDTHQHELREFVRMRGKYKTQETSYYNRIVKVIERANIKIRSVSSSIRTKTCQLIIESLMNGLTDPKELSGLALGKLRKKRKEIEEAVEGKLTSTDLKMLGLLKGDLNHIQNQLQQINQEIDKIVSQYYQEEYELLKKITGVGEISAEKVLAEIGTDLGKFHSADHLTSWAGLAPGNNESAGKQKYSKSRKGNKHLKTTLIQIAWAAVRTKESYWSCKMAEYKRRMKSQKAIVAIGRRMLKLIYNIILNKIEYKEGGIRHYHQIQQRKKTYLALQPV